MIDLNPKQSDIFISDTIENLFVSGLGAGKSFLLGVECAKNMKYKGSLGFLGAPVFDTLKNATLPQVQRAWEALGIQEDRDYVVNIRPPKNWGVPVFSKLSSNKIITTRWGSYIIADGADNYNKYRSVEFDYVLIDELRDMKKEAYDVLRGRLRGTSFKNRGVMYRMLCVTTPPSNPDYLEELLAKKHITKVRGTSYDNKENLPIGYIEGLIESYDDKTAEREILGELVRMTDNAFAYCFEKKDHVKKVTLDLSKTVYLGFDFNVNPITCVAANIGTDYIHICKEFRLEDSNTQKLCERINSVLGQDCHILVTGDASGLKRDTRSKGHWNDYAIIKQVLNLKSKQIKVPNANMAISDSRTLCNSLLARHKNNYIDPSCQHLIRDLQFVKMKGSDIDKTSDSRLTHLLDGWRYLLAAWKYDFVRRYR